MEIRTEEMVNIAAIVIAFSALCWSICKGRDSRHLGDKKQDCRSEGSTIRTSIEESHAGGNFVIKPCIKGDKADGHRIEGNIRSSTAWKTFVYKPSIITDKSHVNKTSKRECDEELSDIDAAWKKGRINVKVEKAKKAKIGKQCYPMTKKPRGELLIINNYYHDHDDEEKKRKGSKQDFRNLKKLFQQLFFEVTEASELTGEQMKRKVAKFSKDITESCQMVVVVLMSHGFSGAIEGIDLKLFKEDDLFEMFTDENCPRLKGIPKLFVFTHCRKKDQQDGSCKKLRDSVIFYATKDGSPSYRNIKDGTYFIKSFCLTFMKYAGTKDLFQLMDKVGEYLKVYHSDMGQQECVYHQFSFCKKLYFNPGYDCDQHGEKNQSKKGLKKMLCLQ